MGFASTAAAQLPVRPAKREPAPRRAARASWGPPAAAGVIAAVDVGTTKVCCLIARTDGEGGVKVKGIGHHLARGLRAGAVVDMDAAEDSICAAVDAAEAMAGEPVRSAYVNISCGRQRSQTIAVEVSVTGSQVTGADIGRATEQAMIRADTSGREVIHAVPTHYSIDGAAGIRDPRGMYGAKLGVNLHVVTADTSPTRNLAVQTLYHVNCVHTVIAAQFFDKFAREAPELLPRYRGHGTHRTTRTSFANDAVSKEDNSVVDMRNTGFLHIELQLQSAFQEAPASFADRFYL